MTSGEKTGDGSPPEDGTVTIVITREPKGYRDWARSYAVMVDETEVAKIRRGQTIEAAVTPGRHEIYLRIDWCRSPRMVLVGAAREVIRLFCAPGGSASEGLRALRDNENYIRLVRQ